MYGEGGHKKTICASLAGVSVLFNTASAQDFSDKIEQALEDIAGVERG
jgi:hypothetical protein